MSYKDAIQKIKPECERAVAFFVKELGKIRTGHASLSLVEDVTIDMFGQKMPLKQVASLSLPEPRQILVQPWDKSYMDPIQKAISQSSLGLSPVADKDAIRIHIPPLTQELRQNLLKVVGEKAEETRKVIRKWREQAWEEIQEAAKRGEIREDDKFRGKDELQKLIDEYNKKIDEIREKKEKEIQL